MGTFTHLIEQVSDETLMRILGIEELRKLHAFSGDYSFERNLTQKNDEYKKIFYPIFKSANKKILISFKVDYYTRTIEIIAFLSTVRSLQPLVQIMKGMISNARLYNFKKAFIHAKGKPGFINEVPLFIDIPTLGWKPVAPERHKILAIIAGHQRWDLDLDNIFTSTEGLTFWAKNGKALKYEFYFGPKSVDELHFYEALANRRLP